MFAESHPAKCLPTCKTPFFKIGLCVGFCGGSGVSISNKRHGTSRDMCTVWAFLWINIWILNCENFHCVRCAKYRYILAGLVLRWGGGAPHSVFIYGLFKTCCTWACTWQARFSIFPSSQSSSIAASARTDQEACSEGRGCCDVAPIFGSRIWLKKKAPTSARS